MTDYPDNIYTPRAKENKSGVVYTPAKKTITYVEDITKLDDEIVSVETELGTNPKGDYADVKTRLESLELNAIVFIIDGGGSAITNGFKGHLEIPFKCEIQRVTLLADAVGDTLLDIWKDTYANFPPTVADTICASAMPELSGERKYQDSTLTDWTKTINAGDILAFNLDGTYTITRLTIVLKVKKIA